MVRSVVDLVAVPLLLLATSCGGSGSGSDGPGSEPHLTEPPPVTLHLDDRDVPLHAWTWCYRNGCADGAPPAHLEDVGSPAEVDFSFPEDDWHFSATFHEHGVERCPRRITMPVGDPDEGHWTLRPVGPAGTWDVDLFGSGPGGDVSTSFTWVTPEDGALPSAPTGSAAVLADHDGALDSYGVEIGVDDLAEQPTDATATVTVTGAEGTSVTIDTRRQRGCYSEGSLWFTAPAAAGRRATRLGTGPFEYVVELTLDGTTYTGRGTWPTGESEQTAPHVPLSWTPRLPRYTG